MLLIGESQKSVLTATIAKEVTKSMPVQPFRFLMYQNQAQQKSPATASHTSHIGGGVGGALWAGGQMQCTGHYLRSVAVFHYSC